MLRVDNYNQFLLEEFEKWIDKFSRWTIIKKEIGFV